MSSYVIFTDMPDIIRINLGTALIDKSPNYLFASPLPYPHINTPLFNSNKTRPNIDSVLSHDYLPHMQCCHSVVDRKGNKEYNLNKHEK